MKNTLYSKMLATYLTVTLTLLILLGVTASAVFVGHYIRERETELTREGGEITAVISDKYMFDEKRNVALDEMITIARKYDALIQLHFFDPHYGNISVMSITDTGKKWNDMSEFFGYMEDIAPGKGESNTENDVFSAFTDMRTMTLVMNITHEGENAGLLCFTVDVTDTYDVISSVIVDILIFSAMGVVLAFLSVLYITERITRPISEVTTTVRKFSKGEYNARISYKSDDEIGELATSFNKMADEVNTLEEARRSFVANVSHELRSPLASMRGFLVAMQDGTIPPDAYDKYLTVVIDENVRMSEMVNDLLDIARIESGGDKVLNFEAFDIAEAIRTTALTFEARANEKQIELRMSFYNEQVYVYADKNQIIHVLQNLIDNAIKFTPPNGFVDIRVDEVKQSVHVSVKDSGVGISQEDLPHVFDRFYKAEKAHTRSTGSGTGLGLAITKKIIVAHGEDIYVTSSNGACFTFTLKRTSKPKKVHVHKGMKYKSRPTE